MTQPTPQLPAPQVPAPQDATPQDAGSAPPRRGATARVLTTLGVLLGVVAIGSGALILVDLAMYETTTQHETYEPAGSVVLLADGHVTVAAAEGDVEVDAVAQRGLRGPRYSAQESADRLEITHRCGWSLITSPRCSGGLEVTLPADTEVEVRTANGDVVASGLAGDLVLSSNNGRVEASEIGGPLTADSDNGDIAVTGAVGDVRASTANGRVSLVDVDGTVDADSQNGDVVIEAVTGDASGTTSNGSVEITQVDGDVRARTSNGRVTVVGDRRPVALTIQTSNGRETVNGPTDPDAARTVEIRSSNGDVEYIVP